MIALALIVSAVLVLAAGHVPLLRLLGPTRDPRVAIVAWMTTIIGALVTLAAGVVLLAVPDHTDLLAMFGLAGSCLAHLGHEELPDADEVGSLLGLAALVAVAARILVVGIRQGRRRAERRERHRFLIHLAAADVTEQGRIVWLNHQDPVAFALAGRPGLIVMSTSMTQRLHPGALTATLEHEHAHLLGRHHLILAVTDTLAAALPVAPLLGTAPAALRTLVEFAADAAAVRRCGAPAVRDALQVFCGLPASGPGLAMAGSTVEHRIARLDSAPPHRRPLARHLSCGLAGLSAALLPVLITAGVFLAVACPVG